MRILKASRIYKAVRQVNGMKSMEQTKSFTSLFYLHDSKEFYLSFSAQREAEA